MALHAPVLYGSQDGGIRVSLTLFFALLILFRRRKGGQTALPLRPPSRRRMALLAITALAGTAAVILGVIIPIRQIEWIGLLLVVYASLTFALPSAQARNAPAALFLLYWANPLPNALFGALQAAMQTASVKGAEWLLHVVNTRVWADGLILRTGTRLFEVPEWCSGMRTATTVFILSLAIGILRRLRPLETLCFVLWSLIHALVLNVLRISAMVYFAPLLKDKAGLGFLHDTAGLIIIAGVFLVYIELIMIEHFRHRRQQQREMLVAARLGGLSEYPIFWHRLRHRRTAIIAGLLLLAVAGGMAWRSRPHHRDMMRRDVVAYLRDNGDTANARRLAGLLSARQPDDLEWRFTVIRLELIGGDAQGVLDALDSLPGIPPAYQTQSRILQAYALLRLDRLAEAVAIVEQLPENDRRTDPRIAMIMAEMALRRNDAGAVAEHVATAGQWVPNAGRIRNLYPFLRIHRQWGAMASTDIPIPYHDPTQAFSILEAFMNLDNVPRVADITLQSLAMWPADPRLIEPLYFMAIKRGDTWEDRFRDHLRRILPGIESPETLFEMLYKCFEIARPDLAWMIYRRMEALDPDHPVLPLSAVEYGHRWFIFRRHHLGLPAASRVETIDLKPFFVLGSLLPEWRTLVQAVPLGSSLATADTIPVRKEFLRQALRAFENLDKDSALSTDLRCLYAQALERNGRLDLARQQIDSIVRANPQEALAMRVLLSEMYERKGAWVHVYETLRTYLIEEIPGEPTGGVDGKPQPQAMPAWPPVPIPRQAGLEDIHLAPLMRLVKAQRELRLPLAARFTASETARLYPYAPQAQALLATTLMQANDAETALHLLGKPRVRNLRELDLLEAEALLATERFGEVDNFCRRHLLPPLPIPASTIQRTALPPAELSLLWHRTRVPSETEFREAAQALRRNLETAGDGLRPLFTLWIEAWEKRCEGDLSNPLRWSAAGRDRLEQATALNQLTLLLCREERFADALPAARAAVAAQPESARLWQILISLSGGDREIIALARRFCPEDADLWLADLVMKTRTADGGIIAADSDDWPQMRKRVNGLLDEALATSGAIHPAGLTRAAEYLWRGGLHDEAGRLATVLTDTARGLLPAHILGIQSALRAKDKRQALHCTTLAIHAATAPMPVLYKSLVHLKSSAGEVDSDTEMVNALRALRKDDPDNPLWPQMLGYIRYQRGGWEILDAMFEMNTAIAGGATNQTPYLISAEVARLLRNYDRAADILRRAIEHHPGNTALLNNLAYVLAQEEKTVPEALALLPRLEAASEADPRIRDTVAMVCLRAGNYDLARETIARNLRSVEPGSPLWFRSQTYLAEIAWKQGQDQTAISMLEQLLKGSRNIPDEDILAANALFTRITAPPPSTEVPK